MNEVKEYKFKTKDGKNVTVRIDRNLCIGAGTCVAMAAKAFALDEQMKAIILGTGSEEDFEAIVAAAKSCPVIAIFVEDEKGKQVYP